MDNQYTNQNYLLYQLYQPRYVWIEFIVSLYYTYTLFILCLYYLYTLLEIMTKQCKKYRDDNTDCLFD